MNYKEEINLEFRTLVTRRQFFQDCGVGLGSMALASLLDVKGIAQTTNPLAPRSVPHLVSVAELRR